MSTTISGDTGVDKVQSGAVKDAMGVTGTATIFGCRAWVNFDGTRNEADTGASVIGQNVKIRASGNVSSVVKNAVGDYTVNFTTAMPDANYAVSAQQLSYSTINVTLSILLKGSYLTGASNKTTTSVSLLSGTTATTSLAENADISVVIFR